MSIRFASTFLSHASVNKELVNEVANELSRRGVLAWLDKDELSLGIDLPSVLFESVERQLTMTAFISAESLESPWCNEELKPCLDAAGDGMSDKILPVYLGDPFTLVNSSSLLRSWWLTPDWSRVSKLGVKADGTTSVNAASIAIEISKAHYQRLKLNECPELIVVLDQRGQGERVGDPAFLPQNWQNSTWPTLVFRPDRGERSEHQVILGAEWDAFRDCMVQTLGQAMGSRRQREVYITGNMQLSFAWLLGGYFNRSSGIKLVTHNPRSEQAFMLNMADSSFLSPPTHINPAEIVWDGTTPDSDCKEISVYLGSPHYLSTVTRYRSETGEMAPLATHITGKIDKIEEVHFLARWLCTASDNRATRVYTALPTHVLTLLAAMLKHGTGHITFMERDHLNETYYACSMPKG